MGTTFGQRGGAGSHPKIWSNTVKTSLRWQEETESNLFPMGQKHLLFLLLTKHISVCLAAISTPALISTDQWLCIYHLSCYWLENVIFYVLVFVMQCIQFKKSFILNNALHRWFSSHTRSHIKVYIESWKKDSKWRGERYLTNVKTGPHRLFHYSHHDQTNAVLTPNVGQ